MAVISINGDWRISFSEALELARFINDRESLAVPDKLVKVAALRASFEYDPSNLNQRTDPLITKHLYQIAKTLPRSTKEKADYKEALSVSEMIEAGRYE